MNEEKIDWLYGRLDGSIKGNYADILNSNSPDNFTVRSAQDYKNDKELVSKYKQEYNDKYKERLDADINFALKDYSNFRMGNFNKGAYSEIMLTPGASRFMPGTQLQELSKSAGSVQLMGAYYRPDLAWESYGHTTVGVQDERSDAANSNVYYELDGTESRMPTLQEVKSQGANDPELAFSVLSGKKLTAEEQRKATEAQRNLYEEAINEESEGAIEGLLNIGSDIYELFAGDENVSGMKAMVGNPRYKDKKGKKIIGWVYQDENDWASGKYKKPGYIAVREGDYLKSAGKEAVSYWDAYHKDFNMKADPFDFLGRSLVNNLNDLSSIPNTVMASVATAFWGNAALANFEQSLMSNRMHDISLAKASQNAGFLGNWDQTAGLVSDVVMQVMSGKIVGSAIGLGVKGLAKAGKFTKLLNYTDDAIKFASMKGANMGSIATMSLLGANDAYKDALANGYSAREASLIYFGNLVAMTVANKYINVLDNGFNAAKNGKVLNSMIASEMAAQKETIKSITQKTVKSASEEGISNEVKSKIIDNGVAQLAKLANPIKVSKSLYTLGKKYIGGPMDKVVGVSKKLGSSPGVQSLVGGALEEASEESLEFIFTEAYNNLFVGVKKLFDVEGEGGRKGHMSSMYDEGYWSEFGTGLIQSALGGAVGGAIMKTKLFKKILGTSDGDQSLKDNLVDVVQKGIGDQYLDLLKKKKEKGELGDVNLSTTLDPISKTYLPVKAAGEGAISMNDALYEILAQQYYLIKNIVSNLGTVEAIEKFQKENPEIVKNSLLTSDLNSLVKRYTGIIVDNDIDEQARPTDTVTINRGDTYEEITSKVKAYAGAAGIDEATAKELLEIQKEIKEIIGGSKAEKYFFQAQGKGTVTDQYSSAEPQLSKIKEFFGDSFLSDLMRETNVSSKMDRLINNKNQEYLEKNEKLISETVDKIKKNSIKFGEFAATLKELKDNKNLVSEESLASLKEAIYSMEAEPILGSKMIDEISEVLLNYSREGLEQKLKDRAEYKSFKTDLQKANYLKIFSFVLPAYEQARIANLNKIVDFTNFSRFYITDTEATSTLSNKFSMLSKINDDGIDTEEYLNDLINSTEEISNDELTSFVNNLSLIIPGTILETGVKAEIPQLADLDEFYAYLNSLTPANFEGAKKSIFNRLTSGFRKNSNVESADHFKLTSTKSLVELIEDLETEYESSVDQESSVNTFRNVDKVYSLQHQIKSRLAQAKLIQGSLTKDINHGSLNTALLEIDYLEDFSNSEYEGDLLNRIFSFNPISVLRLKELTKKDQNKFTESEKSEFLELVNNLDNIKEAVEVLENLEFRVDNIASEAQSNLDLVKDIDSHFDGLLNQTVENEEILKALIDTLEGINPDLVTDAFRPFRDLPITLGEARFHKENIAQTIAVMEQVKSLLYNLDPDTKTKLLEDHFNFEVQLKMGGKNSILTDDVLFPYTKALTFVHFDFQAFYSAQKELYEEDKDLYAATTGKQDQAIILAAAHLTTNISELLAAKIPGSKENSLNNAMALLGVQGSGKSSYVLGTALRISQKLKNANNNVLIASNQPQQLAVLEKTASNFNVTLVNKDLVSEKDKAGKWTPKKLIEILDKPDLLANIDTIVYDEITYVEFDVYSEPTKIADTVKADLNKILIKVNNINKQRAKSGQRPIKLILVGDNSQNGYTDNAGKIKNIGTGNIFLRSERLTENHRSLIKSMTNFIRLKILNRDPKTDTPLGISSINKLQSTWGFIKNFPGYLGGIKLETKSREESFDDDMFDNVRELIEKNKVAGKIFTLGVILPRIEDKGTIPLDTKLGQLINDFPESVSVLDMNYISQSSHDTVQGQEFDYVYAIVTTENIGDSKQSWDQNAEAKEPKAARLLATTLGRAKYFAYVVNESQRDLSSTMVSDITITDPVLNKSLLEEYKNLKVSIVENILGSKLNPEAISTVIEEINAASETDEQVEAERQAILQKIALEEAWAQTINEKIIALDLQAGDEFQFSTVSGVDVLGEFISATSTSLVYKNSISNINSEIIFDKENQVVKDVVLQEDIKVDSFFVHKNDEIVFPTGQEVIEKLVQDAAIENSRIELISSGSKLEFLDLMIKFVNNPTELTPEEALYLTEEFHNKHPQLFNELVNLIQAQPEYLESFWDSLEPADFGLEDKATLRAFLYYFSGIISEVELADALDPDISTFTPEEASSYLQDNYKDLIEKLALVYESVLHGFKKEIEEKVTPSDLKSQIQVEEDQNAELEKELLTNPQPESIIINEKIETNDSVEGLENKLSDDTLSEEELKSLKDTISKLNEARNAVSGGELSEDEQLDKINEIYGPEFVNALNGEFLQLSEIEAIKDLDSKEEKSISKLIAAVEKESGSNEYLTELKEVKTSLERIKEILALYKQGIRMHGFNYTDKGTNTPTTFGKNVLEEYLYSEKSPIPKSNVLNFLSNKSSGQKNIVMLYLFPNGNELLVHEDILTKTGNRSVYLNSKKLIFNNATALVENDGSIDEDLLNTINKEKLVSKINLFQPLRENVSRTEFINQLTESGLDTYLIGYLENEIRRDSSLTVQAKFEQIVLSAKEYVEIALGNKVNNGKNLLTEDYILKQLKAVGLITSNEKFEYKATYFKTKREKIKLDAYGEVAEVKIVEDENVLITATDNSGVTVQIGRFLFESLPDYVKAAYKRMFDFKSSITIDRSALSLEHITPGPIIPAQQNEDLTFDKLNRLRAENPNIQFSPVMTSTATKITQTDGTRIENPFRGEGFILYSFGNKINFDNDAEVRTILQKGLNLKTHPDLNHTFANGIGIIRLDNKLFFTRELLQQVKESSIESKDITEIINTGKTQRDLSNLFVQLLLSNKDYFFSGSTNNDVLNGLLDYSNQATYKTFNNTGIEVKQKIYNGRHLSEPQTNVFAERARNNFNEFLKSALIEGDENSDFQSRLVLAEQVLKLNEESGLDEPSYKTAMDRKLKTVYKYPEIEKDFDHLDFILKFLPVSTNLMESAEGYKPNAYFNLEQFLALFDDYIETKVTTMEDREALFNLVDNIFKSCMPGTLNNGIVARPRIEKIPGTENLFFAKSKINISEDSLPYYSIKVKEFELPQLVLDRAQLLEGMVEGIRQSQEDVVVETPIIIVPETKTELSQETSLDKKRSRRRPATKAQANVEFIPKSDLDLLIDEISNKQNKFYGYTESQNDIKRLEDIAIYDDTSDEERASLAIKLNELSEHLDNLTVNYLDYLLSVIDKPLNIHMVLTGGGSDLELIHEYQATNDSNKKDLIKAELIRKHTAQEEAAKSFTPNIIEEELKFPYELDAQRDIFGTFMSEHPDLAPKAVEVEGYIATLFEGEFPSLDGLAMYEYWNAGTSESNLSDEITDQDLKEQMEDVHLNSLKEIVSSSRLNSPSDIVELKKVIAEKISNTQQLINSFGDEEIKGHYSEKLGKITTQLEEELKQKVEEQNSIIEEQSQFPSWWSTLDATPEEIREVKNQTLAILESSDRDVSELYTAFINNSLPRKQYKFFRAGFLNQMKPELVEKFFTPC